MEKMQRYKLVRSPEYNYTFDRQTGNFARWGKTLQDDPEYSERGPEILDMEVSTICHRNCVWCYKSNTAKGKNMSFNLFKAIFDKIPPNLTQIAFGIGSVDGNPELFHMMAYCRQQGIVPNITINGERLTSTFFLQLVKYCGGISVSNYDKKICYNTVRQLIDAGCKQVNIHQLVAEETYSQMQDVIYDMQNDVRLKELHAVIFLKLKPIGNRNMYHCLSATKFRDFITSALNLKIPIGFDSCSASDFLSVVQEHPDRQKFVEYVESCESFGMFSAYINVEGKYFPCSFAERTIEWEPGLDVLCCNDFLKDIWYNPKVIKWRQQSIASKDQYGCRQCLLNWS